MPRSSVKSLPDEIALKRAAALQRPPFSGNPHKTGNEGNALGSHCRHVVARMLNAALYPRNGNGFCFVVQSSTVAILGSKQHAGRRQTMRTPEARCGPTFMNVAMTEVPPPSPSGPMPASFTRLVISCSISDWLSYRPSTCAWSIRELASKCDLPTPTASVQGEHPSCATASLAQFTISSSTTCVLCL